MSAQRARYSMENADVQLQVMTITKQTRYKTCTKQHLAEAKVENKLQVN